MIISRIIKAPEQSFFLLGPRGSGKSTWLRATFPDAHVIDLLSEETYQRLLANPGLFADELRMGFGIDISKQKQAEHQLRKVLSEMVVLTGCWQ